MRRPAASRGNAKRAEAPSRSGDLQSPTQPLARSAHSPCHFISPPPYSRANQNHPSSRQFEWTSRINRIIRKFMKTLTVIAFFFLTLAGEASAGSKTKIFAGIYQGNASLESSTGDSRFYSPVRVRVSNSGKIVGTAYFSDSATLYRVKGQIRRVKVTGSLLYQAKATGNFSDGTRWVVTFTGSPAVDTRSASGTAKLGDYRGSLLLPSSD